MSAPERMRDGRRIYGEWAGNPRGVLENLDQCIEEVWPAHGGGWIPRQCSRMRGKGKDGLYCGIHAKRNP